jgi:hypothetical protein
MRADAALVGGRGNVGPCGRRHQALDGVDNGDDLLVMFRELPFELDQLLGEFFVGREEPPKPHEGSHDENAHLDGARSIEHGGGHDGAVLGEGVGQVSVSPVRRT